MYDAKTFPTFKQGMEKNMPMPDKLATEAAGLVKLLQDRANGSIPRQVLIPAALLLVLEIAKFMEDSGMAKPTPEDIKAAYEKLKVIMVKAFPKVQARTTPQASAAPPMPAGAPMQPQTAPSGLIQSAQGGM